MDKKITGIVGYITIIGWIVAYLVGDREGAKFHLNQGLVLGLYEIAVGIIAAVVGVIPLIGGVIAGIIGTICGIFGLVCWILGLFYAFTEQEKPLPLLGMITLLK